MVRGAQSSRRIASRGTRKKVERLFVWASQNGAGEGALKHQAPSKENPITFSLEYLDDAELQSVASAFLEWMMTWEYSPGGVHAPYEAAKRLLEKAELEDEYITTLYMMKNRWIEAEIKSAK